MFFLLKGQISRCESCWKCSLSQRKLTWLPNNGTVTTTGPSTHRCWSFCLSLNNIKILWAINTAVNAIFYFWALWVLVEFWDKNRQTQEAVKTKKEGNLTAERGSCLTGRKTHVISCNVSQIYPEETKTFSGWNKCLKNERNMSAWINSAAQFGFFSLGKKIGSCRLSSAGNFRYLLASLAGDRKSSSRAPVTNLKKYVASAWTDQKMWD